VWHEDTQDDGWPEVAKRRLGGHAQNLRAFRRFSIGGLKAHAQSGQRANQLAGPGADFENGVASREPAQRQCEGINQLPADGQEASRLMALVKPARASFGSDQTLTPPSEAR